MAGLEPFVESTTPLIAFSSTMLATILLTFPVLYLYEEGRDLFNKKRGGRQIRSSDSKSRNTTSRIIDDVESSITTVYSTEILKDNYEQVQVVNRCIQCDPCDFYVAESKLKNLKPPPRKDYASTSEIETDYTTSTEGKLSETFVENQEQLTQYMYKETVSDADVVTDYCYIIRPKRRESTTSDTLLTTDADDETQTSIYDFDMSRDCIMLSDDDQPSERVIIAKSSRFQPAKSQQSLKKISSIKMMEQPADRAMVIEEALLGEPQQLPPKDTPKPGRVVRYQPIVSNNRILCSRKLSQLSANSTTPSTKCSRRTRSKEKCCKEKCSCKQKCCNNNRPPSREGSKSKFY